METLILCLVLLFSTPVQNRAPHQREKGKALKTPTYTIMVKMLRSGKPSPRRRRELMAYADAFERGSKEFKIDLDLILAVGLRESSFRNIQEPRNRGTGVMQVIPNESHIKDFINKNFGKPNGISYKKWVRRNPIKAIRVGIGELDFYRRNWHRYIKQKCRRQMTERREITLSPYKVLSPTKRKRMKFLYISHYNWGPRCLYHTKSRSYPYLVMKNYRQIQKLRKSLSLY